MNEEFNVALIGVGNWGSILKRYIKEDMRFNLKYICNSKSNLDEIFEDPDVDVVVIATPDKTHADLVLKALNYNKHVFCEKPLALRYSQVLLIKILAKEKRKVVITDYIYTFSRGLKKIQELIGSKEIGQLKQITLISRQLGDTARDVYWVLGSHMLSILNMFVSIEECDFDCENIVNNKNQIHTALIRSSNELNVCIDISLSESLKDRRMFFRCDKASLVFHPILNKIEIVYDYTFDTIECDESQNIRLSLDKLYDCLMNNDVDNLDSACLITKVLNELGA